MSAALVFSFGNALTVALFGNKRGEDDGISRCQEGFQSTF